MYRNRNFGLVFGRGEILLKYMIFVCHWTSKVSRTLRKIEKGQKKIQRPQTRPQLHSYHRSNLSLKAIKAKKAKIRPNDSKLDFRIFRGLAMVPQHAKRSYKVPWRPIGIRFWETTTPEPKKGPAGPKTSSGKKLIKIKVEFFWFSSIFRGQLLGL